ncbi:hypothetical protein [Geothrix sp. PMB-07]|uniref:hypothetical protein n=1 Tax=Geothrix sp. PMB-07 TaxID=3068640 RepID=UPI002741D154|nr:hypothetical protein [Geothrix sp. PMB-07]WLT31443.1 hypothetical protein Q9293_17170 [Geothrix sp. PMB-07]
MRASRGRRSWRIILALAGCLLGPMVAAEDALHFSLQAGLQVPTAPDLKRTAGTGPSPNLGAMVAWGSREDFALRLRVDMTRFREARQEVDSPGLKQAITTKVRSESVGLEQLDYEGPWSFGAGLYAVRWTVDSANRLESAGDVFEPRSTTRWTRLGLGLMVGRQWSKHTDVELRFMSSHYGQENQPTNVVSVNLVWTF